VDEVDRTASDRTIKREERSISIKTWQNRWDWSTKGRWTNRLILDIDRWLQRESVLTYHLTQALSGHGCFRHYLNFRNRADDDLCVYYGEIDTAEHTIFYCMRWDDHRKDVVPFLNGRPPSPTYCVARLG